MCFLPIMRELRHQNIRGGRKEMMWVFSRLWGNWDCSSLSQPPFYRIFVFSRLWGNWDSRGTHLKTFSTLCFLPIMRELRQSFRNILHLLQKLFSPDYEGIETQKVWIGTYRVHRFLPIMRELRPSLRDTHLKIFPTVFSRLWGNWEETGAEKRWRGNKPFSPDYEGIETIRIREWFFLMQ